MPLNKLDFCHRVYSEIRSVTAAFQAYMNPLFAEVGLKPLEGYLLAELSTIDGCTVGELSHATSISQTNMPPLWRALEGKGVIERRRDEEDGRSYRLFLTDAGHETLSRLDELVGDATQPDAASFRALQERAFDGFAACRELLAQGKAQTSDSLT